MVRALSDSLLPAAFMLLCSWKRSIRSVFFFVHPWELATASELYLRFNALDDLLPTYESLSGIAVDPYIAVREAYIQYREARVKR